MGVKRTVKRRVAKLRIGQRHKKQAAHEKEMTRLGLQRNKMLKEAAEAADKAEALEKKRQAEEKRAKALAPLKAAQVRARKRRAATAKKQIKSTIASFKPIYKFIKGK